jgi:hypothetical protein
MQNSLTIENESIGRKALGGIASFFLLMPVPWMGAVIGVGLLWDQAWLRIRETAPAQRIGAVFTVLSIRLAKVMMRDERNAPYLFSLFGIGLYTPVLFILAFCWQMRYGTGAAWYTVVLVAFLYNVLMMGPYFRFFSVIATLIHKEGHDTRGLFKEPYTFLNNAFGWFIGPFYGHVPETYPLGHQRIHHKYDNGPGDVTFTYDLDRRDPAQWLKYLRRFSLYWTGVSIVGYFAANGQWKPVRRMAAGMLAYYGLIAVITIINPWFGFAYLILPHMSVIIYLGAINYIWHTFCDPADPDNPYINSVTILDGHYNVFNEDFHVTHHHHPQMHWTKMANDYYSHTDKYKSNMASVFRDTQEFEMFVWVMMGRIDLLAEHYVDLTGTLSQEDKVALLRYRMQPVQRVRGLEA